MPLSLGLVCIAALTLAGAHQSQLPPMLQGVKRIVMMGDSITQLGGSPKGYVTLVDQTLLGTYPGSPIEVINAGISGEKSTDMHRRFQRDVIDRHPDLVTLSVGVNDVWHDYMNPEWTKRQPNGDSGRGVKLPVYIQEVEAMVTEAQGVGAKMVLVSPTLIYEDLTCEENRRLKEYVDAEREIAKRHHAVFIDLNREFTDVVSSYQRQAGRTTLLLTVDGVHMNDQGNALMADSILRTVGVPVPDKLAPYGQ